jgi:hypothetical protein
VSGLGGADDRVAADPNAGALSDPAIGELSDGLVDERSRAGDDADVPLLEDVTGHDADARLARRDDAGTVRSDDRDV